MATYGYLAHHGVKGQKWGIRRYQNKDGTLTSEGRKRYNVNMYSHSGNRIYSPLGVNAKVKKRSNAANSFQGGDVYNDFERKLRRSLKKDYRDSYKKGYITRDEYRQGKKIAKQSSKLIAEQRLGKTAKKYGKAVKIAGGIANGMIIGSAAVGAALAGKGAYNAQKDMYNKSKDYTGAGSWREYDENTGKYGKEHKSYKEFAKDMDRKTSGKKSKYGYYSFDYDNSATLAHHGIKGMKWGIRRYQNEDGTLTEAGKKRYYSYDSAKRARFLKGAGMAAGLGVGALSAAGLIKQAHDEEKDKVYDYSKTKEYKNKQNLQTAAYGTAGISGMISGVALNAHYDNKLNNIIRNSSDEEFNKIKNDKRFMNNPVVKNRVHFDNFEKRNKITKNMSNHQKADLYVKEMFKKNKPISKDIYGIDDSDAWYNAKLGGDWYGIKDADLEKMCWKYHNQYTK